MSAPCFNGCSLPGARGSPFAADPAPAPRKIRTAPARCAGLRSIPAAPHGLVRPLLWELVREQRPEEVLRENMSILAEVKQ